jgi:hypothetical protein
MRARTEQLQLISEASDASAALTCRGIFSLNYLARHFAEHLPYSDEVRDVYEAAKTRWHENLAGLRRQKEAYTRTEFLDPLFKDLGWHFIPEAELPKGPTRKRPDYALFPTATNKQQAAIQNDTVDVFRFADSVAEAKKWQHPLDEVSEKETPGWFPSQQVQDYLRHAKDQTGARFFNWAVLTNGNAWRLYCEQAANDAYFEFTMAEQETFCSIEDFRFFVALFRPQAFARNTDGRCLLDDVREESLIRQAELELNLRRRIFDVLEDLASGFRDYQPNGITETGYGALYDNSLIFLYRLLFVLYAESRALLPVRPHGYGSNKIYREKYSLGRLVSELRDKSKFTNDAFTDLYEQLLRLFRLINGDNEAQNNATGVARYNGGLFNPQLHPLLEKWRIGDGRMASVLRQLIFSQPPARSTAKQQVIQTEEAVDYGSLEVRQLGDIYEGLLGAHLEDNAQTNRLELRNQNGTNHRHGIYYTPDWIVRYLLRETLQPLIDEINESAEVKAAMAAKSDEKKRNNSFALAVLKLNVVDPAMGSAHFLVRATEWLAEQILYHSTTQLMTEQIVPLGANKRTREDILKRNKIPVSPGVSQEQAETAYWRRRVVEACIYGVDLNPLAVELAKLSLWLTCIAVDEPLNFLDHHLREGNSLLFARPEELSHSPAASAKQKEEAPVFSKDELPQALSSVIRQNVDIEQTASTEMELVKEKEKQWKNVRGNLRPFLNIADLWLAAFDGLPVDELNYRTLVRLELAPAGLNNQEKAEAKKLRESLQADLVTKKTILKPFHWHMEFPDVFFQPDGTLRPVQARGFDAVLGNPPYIRRHVFVNEAWANCLLKRLGDHYDIYVYFVNLGFDLLRPGGGFGFITSDTYFTLDTLRDMRELLQEQHLTHLGQCDPFDATVDAAIFVARKVGAIASPKPPILFIQARPRKSEDGRTTDPERHLLTLPHVTDVQFTAVEELKGCAGNVRHLIHGALGSLRVHEVPIDLYQAAHKRAFFEPSSGALKLFARFNKPVKQLFERWWQFIASAKEFESNRELIERYQRGLKAGEITLVGLIAEGAQGMRTGNNARFLGYLEGTPQATELLRRRKLWTEKWQAHAKIRSVFDAALLEFGGDTNKPLKDAAAWEASVERLKTVFTLEALGFSKSDLYRIVPKALVADVSHAPGSDSHFAWEQRKTELLSRWRTDENLKNFGTAELKETASRKRSRQIFTAASVSDEDFCVLCQEIQAWVAEENVSRRHQRKQTIPRDVIGLRSAEDYTDSSDGPRIATIYNGLSGRGRFVPFRKGDPEGSRWIDNEPLFIDWSKASVDALSTAPEARWQGHRYFLEAGLCWSLHANHVRIKARMQPACVFDASGSRLTPKPNVLNPQVLLALMNSDVFSFFLKKFIKHNQDVEINDLRGMPLVVPTIDQASRLMELAAAAVAVKGLLFKGAQPSHEIASTVRNISNSLDCDAPAYLKPSAQRKLLATATDCLEVIELAVNWEAEKLYGVEGWGPFDEF